MTVAPPRIYGGTSIKLEEVRTHRWILALRRMARARAEVVKAARLVGEEGDTGENI